MNIDAPIHTVPTQEKRTRYCVSKLAETPGLLILLILTQSLSITKKNNNVLNFSLVSKRPLPLVITGQSHGKREPH